MGSCAADGYSQSRYTISVGAYSQVCAPASYDEQCSAKFTVAYVENTLNENLQVVSTSYIDMNIEHELFMWILIHLCESIVIASLVRQH